MYGFFRCGWTELSESYSGLNNENHWSNWWYELAVN
jgi:hypothetical protein